MSFEATLREQAIARRKRLFTPPRGRISTEIEILSTSLLARQRRNYAERIRKIERYEKMRLAFKAYQAAFIHRCPQPIKIVVPVSEPTVSTEEPPLLDATTVWPITVRDIARAACRYFEVSMIDMVSHRRHARIVRVRQIAMHLARAMTLRSYPEIGRIFGNRDHTTVMHADAKMKESVQTDPSIAADVEAIRAIVMGSRP